VGSGSGSVEISVSGAERIGQVRFEFGAQENGYVGYRELDVIGSPSPPNPSVGVLDVTINGANDPVTANDDQATVTEDAAATLDLAANDDDADINDVLTVTAIGGTPTGNVTLNGDGTVNYDPTGVFDHLVAGETATDTFTYTVSDGDPVVGYWRMEQDDDAGSGFSVPNEVAGGSPLVGSAGSVEALNGNGFADPIPQTGAANTSGLNGSPNINGTVAPYAELDTESITVEMYVRSNEGDARLINSGFSSGSDGYRIHQPNTLQVQYHVDDGSGGATLVTIDSGINLDGDWDHVAWTYDAATGIGRVYLNGAQVAMNDGPDGRALVHDTGANVQIGDGFDGGGPFSGNDDALIDEVRISAGALPAGRLLSGTDAPSTDTATITVTIIGQNDDALGGDDTATANEDGPAIDIDVLANDDADVDGTPPDDTLTVVSVDSGGTIGVVTNNGADVTYDPNGQFETLPFGATATDTFTYTMTDVDPASIVGYWRMEQDDDADASAYSVPNEIAGGSPLVGSNGSVEALNGTGFDDPLPQTGAANASGLNGSPNINGTIAPYAELDTSSITVEMYVRSNEGDARLINSGFTSGTDGYRIHQPNGVQVQYHVDDGSGGATLVTINSGINLGANWEHVAWTYDAATGIGRVYLNGVQVAMNDGPDGRDLIHDTAADIQIGEGFDGGGPFSGNSDALIDEVRISNNAKTPGQLLSSPLGTATVTVIIEGAADAPTNADAGGPYSTTEGQDVSFSASFDDPDIGDTHTFEWTVGGQVVSTDQNPTVAWADLVAVGGDDGPGTFDVVFTVTDAGGLSDSSMTTLDITNAPPVAAIAGVPDTDPPASQAVLGIPVDFTLIATDPSGTDQTTGFTFNVDWGDGVQQSFPPMAGDPLVASPLQVTHEFENFGTVVVTVTATDKDGAESDPVTHTINIVPVAVVNDTLQVTGTPDSDTIIFFPEAGGITVRYNNVWFGPYSFGGGIVVNGEEGSDRIVFAQGMDRPARINGGTGNDYIAAGTGDDVIEGGPDNDIILAGEGNNWAAGDNIDGPLTEIINGQPVVFPDGNDRIEGRSGIDVLFGNGGNDRIDGAAGDDILDGGLDNDVLFGGHGDDLLIGREGSDTINGYFGDDVILGGDGTDQLFGNHEQDLIAGGLGFDRLRGDNGDDDLIGGTTALDDDIEGALAAMLADLGNLDLASADANVAQQVGEWFSTGNDRAGFEPAVDDGNMDDLTGGSGFDQFHTEGDRIRGLEFGEEMF